MEQVKLKMPERIKNRRQTLAKQYAEIMGAWKWAPDRLKGRPKKSYNEGRDRAVDPSVIIKLEEAFTFGASLAEALVYANVSTTAYYHWLEINPSFSKRIEELRLNPNIRARKSVFARMKYDADLALKFLERKLPEEFSLKAVVKHDVEFTGIAIDRPKIIEQNPVKLIEIEEAGSLDA